MLILQGRYFASIVKQRLGIRTTAGAACATQNKTVLEPKLYWLLLTQESSIRF